MTGAYNWHYLLFLSSKYIHKYVHNLYIVSNEIINARKYKFKGNKVNSCFTFIAQSICMVTCFLWEPWNSSAWNLDASHGMHQNDMNIAQTILHMFWELNRVLPRRHGESRKKKKDIFCHGKCHGKECRCILISGQHPSEVLEADW